MRGREGSTCAASFSPNHRRHLSFRAYRLGVARNADGRDVQHRCKHVPPRRTRSCYCEPSSRGCHPNRIGVRHCTNRARRSPIPRPASRDARRCAPRRSWRSSSSRTRRSMRTPRSCRPCCRGSWTTSASRSRWPRRCRPCSPSRPRFRSRPSATSPTGSGGAPSSPRGRSWGACSSRCWGWRPATSSSSSSSPWGTGVGRLSPAGGFARRARRGRSRKRGSHVRLLLRGGGGLRPGADQRRRHRGLAGSWPACGSR